MSKGWHIDWPSDTLFYPNGKAVLCKMGYEEAVELTAALNALQAVAEEAKAFNNAISVDSSSSMMLATKERLTKLRTALAGLEATHD